MSNLKKKVFKNSKIRSKIKTSNLKIKIVKKNCKYLTQKNIFILKFHPIIFIRIFLYFYFIFYFKEKKLTHHYFNL